MINEYVWVSNKKIVVINSKIKVGSISTWSFDGSSCNMAHIENSDVMLYPIQIYKHPTLDGNLVLCETEIIEPIKNTNKKFRFGYEQEYYIFPHDAQMDSTNNYCGNNIGGYIERCISDEHLVSCLKSGVTIGGTNREVGKYQWEFQIDQENDNIQKLCNDVIIARYILIRIAEKYNYKVCFDPKPFDNKAGSGGHINISFDDIRTDNFEDIKNIVELYGKHHDHFFSISGLNMINLHMELEHGTHQSEFQTNN
jgi:glutamine synthetase